MRKGDYTNMKKIHKCIDCRKKVSKNSKRCRSCARKYQYATRPETNPMFGKKGKLSSNYKEGQTLEKHYCSCGKEIHLATFYRNGQCWNCHVKSNKGKNHPMFGKHHTKKSKEKIKAALIGLLILDKNPNWKGGLSKLPYAFEFTKELKESIRKRDNYTCQKCGIKQKLLTGYHKKLSIHHIDYDKNNCSIDNLITLCKKCNSEVNANRDYWYAYFKYLLGD